MVFTPFILATFLPWLSALELVLSPFLLVQHLQWPYPLTTFPSLLHPYFLWGLWASFPFSHWFNTDFGSDGWSLKVNVFGGSYSWGLGVRLSEKLANSKNKIPFSFPLQLKFWFCSFLTRFTGSSWTFTNNALGVSMQLLNPAPQKEKEEKHHYMWARRGMVGTLGHEEVNHLALVEGLGSQGNDQFLL